MYQQQVKVKKASLSTVCLDNGKPKLVKGDHKIGTQNFADGTLVFCGFRGNKVATNVWGGVYCFDTAGHKKPTETITPVQLDAALANGKSSTKRKK